MRRGYDAGLAGGEASVGVGGAGSVGGDQRYAVGADDAPGPAGVDASRDLAGLALGDRSQRLQQAEVVVDRFEVAALVPVPSLSGRSVLRAVPCRGVGALNMLTVTDDLLS